MKKRSSNDFVSLFDKVLTEAATMFNRPKYEVNSEQFYYVGNNRVSRQMLQVLGGFKVMKNYCAPAPNVKHDNSGIISMIERLAANAKKSA